MSWGRRWDILDQEGRATVPFCLILFELSSDRQGPALLSLLIQMLISETPQTHPEIIFYHLSGHPLAQSS